AKSVSFSVDYYIAAEPSKLYRDHIADVFAVGHNECRRDIPVRLGKTYLSRHLQRIDLCAINDCAVVDTRLASRIELHTFHECVLCRRIRISDRVLKRGERIRRRRSSDSICDGWTIIEC